MGLLCARAVKYHQALGSGGSPSLLSRSELAGLLSGLDGLAMNLALAKYMADHAAERMLIAQVREWAAGVAVREHWQVVRGRPTVCNMAALAVLDVVRPNRCCKCEGRGMAVNKVCKYCEGSGLKPLSGRKIAEVMGIDEATYRKLWRARYELCLDHVQRIDANVNRVIRLSDRDLKYGY
jgi:hypothetical protein